MLKGDISGLYGDDEVIIADGRLNAEYVSDAVSEAVPEMCTGCSLFSFMPEADAFCAESFIGNKSIREKARKITLRLCGMKPYRYAVLVRKDFFSGDLYSVFLFRDKKSMLARIRFSDFPLSERGGKAAANVIGTKELADGLSEKISEGRASAEEINKSLRLLKSRALTDELLLSLSCAPEGESFPINIRDAVVYTSDAFASRKTGITLITDVSESDSGEFCSSDIRPERLICALFSLIRAAADLSSDCKVNFSLRSRSEAVTVSFGCHAPCLSVFPTGSASVTDLAQFAPCASAALLICDFIVSSSPKCMLDMKYSHESETLAFELSFGRACDFPEFKSRDPFAEADKIMRICDDVILFREEAQR